MQDLNNQLELENAITIANPRSTSKTVNSIDSDSVLNDNNEISSGHTIVGVSNLSVAFGVIRALRSSSNSSRNYKQNATKDDFLIQGVNDLNRLVEKQQQRFNEIRQNSQAHASAEKAALDSLKAYELPAHYSNTIDVLSSDDERDFRDSPTGQDFDANRWEEASRAGGGSLDHYDAGDEDTEAAELAELLTGFTAPVNSSVASSKGVRGSRMRDSNDQLPSIARKCKSSTASSPCGLDVRGVAHQNCLSASPISGNRDDIKTAANSWATTTAPGLACQQQQLTMAATSVAERKKSKASTALSQLRPGQAIRVRVPKHK